MLTEAGDLPKVSTQDRMINPDNQRRTAERMGTRRTIELDASHASPASLPGPVTDLIVEAGAAG